MDNRLEDNLKNKEEILFRLREKLINNFYLNISPEKITKNTNFRTNLHMDSLNRYEFCFYMEDEFNISIEDEDVSKLKTVGDYVDYVFKKQNNQ